jgi:hypothetical protein
LGGSEIAIERGRGYGVDTWIEECLIDGHEDFVHAPFGGGRFAN